MDGKKEKKGKRDTRIFPYLAGCLSGKKGHTYFLLIWLAA